jgi:hypothetical protein
MRTVTNEIGRNGVAVNSRSKDSHVHKSFIVHQFFCAKFKVALAAGCAEQIKINRSTREERPEYHVANFTD